MNIFQQLSKKSTAWKSAFQAGWIAHRCPDCVVDDEKEEIFACPKHEAEIAQLAEENQKSQ